MLKLLPVARVPLALSLPTRPALPWISKILPPHLMHRDHLCPVLLGLLVSVLPEGVAFHSSAPLAVVALLRAENQRTRSRS